jgi:hypothetical protein
MDHVDAQGTGKHRYKKLNFLRQETCCACAYPSTVMEEFQMRRVLSLFAVVFSLYSAQLVGQDQPKAPPATAVPAIACTSALPQAAAGEDVVIACDNLPPQEGRVWIKGINDPTTGKGTQVRGAVEGKNLTFRVPDSLPAGLYVVSVASDTTKEPVSISGQLDVLGPVVLEAIYPLTNYPLGKGFDFELVGKNFTKLSQIEVGNQGTVPVCAADTTASSGVFCRKDIVFTDASKLKVTGFYPGRYYGPLQIKVRVGSIASKPLPVTFAVATPQGVALAAAAVFLVLAFVLYGLASKGLTQDTIDGLKPSPLTSLFLDRQTNSYSLSKFQVLAWTGVTVYSYVYLFLCRTLIQGDFRFPDVSQNLPQLFFVSAGTTVAATAITANWGSKGAGAIRPSFSDFISTGGLVAGDRFQFFIWTLVGCAGYVYLVISMNPETANISLPEIPQNFLYLMGVSSAGYLGGKLVRKPGPVIKNLSVAKVTPVPAGGAPADPAAARTLLDLQYRPPDVATRVTFPVLTLNLKGENIDPTGKMKVDGQPLRGDIFWINAQPDPQTGFCTDVNVSLNDAAKFIDGSHELMLVNGDGQSSTVSFPVDPLTVDPIADQATGNAPVDVAVTGKNFVTGITAEWKNPAETGAPGNAPVTFVSATKLTATVVPGAAGTGKLTLISPIGLRASASVTVK